MHCGNLRAAASSAIGAGGFAAGIRTRSPIAAGTAARGEPEPANGAAAAAAGNAAEADQGSAGTGWSGQVGAEAAPGAYWGTNAATAWVDEPDLVKTDGLRTVAVIGGVLRVVDA